ncbi:MAG TPA: hypothetical protein VM074_06105 [Solimonas sp.]|nr:hypothetical protein [Solimonas sp.]
MLPSDIQGYTRLAFDATVKMTDLVEAMHLNISQAPWVFGETAHGRTHGITGLVYRSIRTIAGLIGTGVDQLFEQLNPLLEQAVAKSGASSAREAFVAAVNGVMGDHLEGSGNPLAIPMRLRIGGQALELECAKLAQAVPEPKSRLLVLVHGLYMSDVQWRRQDHDHGAELAQELDASALYLHYNSGRHISVNGREFSATLEKLVREWPVPVTQLTIVGHSMGGLVARSACHYAEEAGYAWRNTLTDLVLLGAPHHGAPMERGGNWLHNFAGITPYTAPLARLGMIRSAGVTDLRHGNLIDEDWHGRDRFEQGPDPRRPLPLPANVRCYAVAVTTGLRRGDLGDRCLGDGLVPIDSALGRHADPQRALPFEERQTWLGFGMNHWDLLSRPEVYQRLRGWLAQN